MKKPIIAIVILPLILTGGLPGSEELFTEKRNQRFSNSSARLPDINHCIRRLYFLESSNGKLLVGDGGKAIGPLQIWKIMVRQVNNIVGYNRYTYEDRHCLKKSKEMCTIFLARQIRDYRRVFGIYPTNRLLIRSWRLGRIEFILE